MSFADLTKKLDAACIKAFSEPVQFNFVDVRGIVKTELIEFGGYDGVTEKRTTVTVQSAEVGEIKNGQSVIIHGKTYKVDQLMEGKFDFDGLVKVVLR